MKKITLCGFLICGLMAFGQEKIINGGTLNAFSTIGNSWTPPTSPILKPAAPASTLSNSSRGILNWAQAMASFGSNNGFSGDYSTIFMSLFMDQTAMFNNNGTKAAAQAMRIGQVFDPKSVIYNLSMNTSQPYTLDTLVLFGNYQVRVNQADTLEVEIMWGDTLTDLAYWGTQAPAGANIYTPHFKPSANNGNVSHLTAPASHHVIIKRVITAADTVTDPSVLGLYNSPIIIVPSNPISIPGNNNVAITYTYVPGKDYTNGGVVFDVPGGSKLATQNGFSASLVVATSGPGFYDYDAKYKNVPVLENVAMRYDQETGGNAILDTTMASFFNFGLNFAYNITAIIHYSLTTGINEVTANNLHVTQNMPNPFSETTLINYELAEASNVSLNVYDLTGKKIQTIDQGRKMPGSYEIQFSSSDLQAGMYFYTLTAGGNQITKRMTIVK